MVASENRKRDLYEEKLGQLRAGSNKALPFVVICITLEVGNEKRGKIKRFRVPGRLFLIGIPWVKNGWIDSMQFGWYFQVEERDCFGRCAIYRAIKDGINNPTRVLYRNTFPTTVPSGIDQVGLCSRYLHAFYQFNSVLGRMQQ